MSFDMDSGSTGAEGPWISWSARGTQDGEIPAKSFYLRDEGEKSELDAFKSGVVMDIDNMKTGWQHSEGVVGQAPDWKWNQSIKVMMPAPSDEYKKGFEIRCAIGGGKAATWQQAGAAVWNAFAALVPALRGQPGGKLPLVRMTGTKAVQFKRGSTVEPIFEVVKWVDRPDCLNEQAAPIATEEEKPKQAQAKKPAPAPADMDDF